MTIEVTAKKVDEAIKNGLEQLGASLDEVQVEVIESGGLFRKAKVRLTLDRETSETAEETHVAPEPKKEEKPEVKHEPKKDVATPEKKQADNAAQKKPDAPKPEAKAHDKKSEKPVKKAEQSKNDKSAGRPAPEPAEKTETSKSGPSAKGEQSQKSAETTKSAKKSAKKESQPKDRKDDRETGEPSVKRTREEQAAARKNAAAFIKDIVEKMGFEASVELDEANGECINITADAGDDSLLIGRHGETLTALSYIAETAARAEKNRVDIIVDCNGYRERRAASLSAMARRRANECANKHRRIKLEPMERIDRRTIHNALTGDDRVTTASEGKEPYRYVVILPANSHKRRDQKPHHDEPVAQAVAENGQEQE